MIVSVPANTHSLRSLMQTEPYIPPCNTDKRGTALVQLKRTIEPHAARSSGLEMYKYSIQVAEYA